MQPKATVLFMMNTNKGKKKKCDDIHKASWEVFRSQGQDFPGLMLLSDLGQTS